MEDTERYGLNVVAAQVEDAMTQEAFRDQERVNGDLRSQIVSLSSQVASLRLMIKDQAEVLSLYMDG